MRRVLSTLVQLALATPALAVDGVKEINQACAVQTGCFAGDTPGYPVTITTSGSYRLTSNLTGIGANVDGIFLTASRITIDFNGFSLAGFSLGDGTGNGITGGGVDGAFAGFTTIKNGVIRGFRAKGVALAGAKGVRIENMIFDFNAGGGVEVGAEASVLRNRFSSNGGITLFSVGLQTGLTALIVENVVGESGGDGIRSGAGSTVTGNTAHENGIYGINAGNGSTVSGNTARQNGGDGITVTTASRVEGNTCDDNGLAGVHSLFGRNRIDGNTVTDNNGGLAVDRSGNLIIRNSAKGNSANYSQIVGGNTVGEVIDTTGAGGTITETASPWANFSF